MTKHDVSDEKCAAALVVGRAGAEAEIRARTVRYVADRDAIEIVTTGDAGFLVPRSWITALRDVPINELVQLEMWPDGSAIELDSHDIQLSVDGLLTAMLPKMLPARTVAIIFASRGGQTISAAKRTSAQENGRRGGRPRKAGGGTASA